MSSLVIQSIRDVPIGVHLNLVEIRVAERAPHLARAAHDERPGWNLGAFGEQRPRRNDGAAADYDAVQQDGPHPNQAAVLDRAAVHDRGVADRDIVADEGGMGVLPTWAMGPFPAVGPPPTRAGLNARP